MPLTFDLSRDKLNTYQGTNPRPEDFDAFWDESIQEMRDVDPQVEIEPAEFQIPYAICSHLRFTGVGGSRIHAKLVQPKDVASPHPALLQFHGYSGNSGDWFDKLPYVSMGFTVAAMDCRGQGGFSEDRGGVVGNTLRGHIIRGLDDQPKNMLYRNIFLDTAMLARVVMDMDDVDADRVGVSGGSQGGGLTLACAALEPRIKKAAPSFPFLCDYKRVWEMDQAKRAYEELQQYFRRFDPLHEREDEVFMRLGYIDIQHFAPRIKAEVMMAIGLMDTTCPPSTQFAAYNKISSPKHLVEYPDFGHEMLPGHPDRTLRFLADL